MESTAGGPFLGNRQVVERLESRIAGSSFPHALIFSGPEGIGKHTLAIRLAQQMNCTRSSPPCGQCDTCTRIRNGVHPDVATITVADDATQIKIEQIRRIRTAVELGALEANSRVFIIDPADGMNANAANSLLKVLEEPPPHVHFVLVTTNAHELPITVRSRCQIHHFSPLSLEEIRASGVDDELVVRWSQGSVGRALATDPADLREERDRMLRFVDDAVDARDVEWAALVEASAEFGRARNEFRDRLRTLIVIVGDILYAKEGMPERVANVDEIERICRIAGRVDTATLVRIGQCIRFIELALKNNVNRQMLTDNLLVALNGQTSQILNDKVWDSR